jgi:hypothetical protein
MARSTCPVHLYAGFSTRFSHQSCYCGEPIMQCSVCGAIDPPLCMRDLLCPPASEFVHPGCEGEVIPTQGVCHQGFRPIGDIVAQMAF